MWCSWQGDVDPGERFGFFLQKKICRSRFDCGSDSVANFIEQFANYWFFVFAECFHPLAPRGNAAVAPKITHAHSVQRRLLARITNFAQRFVSELFERM